MTVHRSLLAVAFLGWPLAAPASDADTAARIVGAALVRARAYQTLQHLTDRIGPRLSGSKNLEQAVEWTAATLRAQGADRVAVEPVLVPHWVRGKEVASIVAPVEAPLVLTTLGGSVATPAGGIEAEVIEVASFDELRAAGERVRGKIVLYNRDMARGGGSMDGYGAVAPLRTQGAIEAARMGAVAALVRSLGTAAFRLPHTGAMSYEDSVPKIPAAALAEEDADHLHRLLAAGDIVRVRLELGCATLPDATSANVVADFRGRELPDEIVVIGAHLDSWDLGTGAVDDGAGVAVVMDTLRLLHELDLRPRRTIRAVLFTNEENGLRGGREYARAHAGELARHVAAIETDSGAGRPLGFGITAGTGAEAVLRTIAAHLAPLGADQVSTGGGGADISPMKPAGVPQIGLRADTTTYFDIHHSNADTFDKVDRQDLHRQVAAMAVMAYFLADAPEPLPRFVPPPEERREGGAP